MAVNDSSKRKEPEPEQEKPAATKEVAPQADKATAETKSEPDAKRLKKEEEAPQADKATAETKNVPDAKRLKPTPPDPAVVRKQVEYYLSDENLKYDKFFHEKISADAEGWLEMSLVLSCNKMKALRAIKEDVVKALQGSKLELRDGGAAVRRPSNLALPKLETRPIQHQKKSSLHAHDGGCLVVFKDVPAEQSWVQVKEKLKETLPEKANLWFVSEVNDKCQCFIACAPFDDDVKFFEDLKLEVGGAKLACEICQAGLLQNALKLLPKHIRERREKESRKRQKDRNRPIVVGTQKFLNVGALRGRVKEIINSRSDGEHLKPDGSDFKLIKALLEHHPKGAQKSQGMVGIKVAQSTQGDNRCFFMVKENGDAEDFSAKKCLDAIELNPPYAKAEPPKDKKEVEKTSASAASAKATATADQPSKEPEAKAAEKTEAKVEEKTEAKVEEKIEAKVEGKIQAKVEETTEAKVEEKAEAKAEEKTEAKAEDAKTEAKPEEAKATPDSATA